MTLATICNNFITGCIPTFARIFNDITVFWRSLTHTFVFATFPLCFTLTYTSYRIAFAAITVQRYIAVKVEDAVAMLVTTGWLSGAL